MVYLLYCNIVSFILKKKYYVGFKYWNLEFMFLFFIILLLMYIICKLKKFVFLEVKFM